MPRRMRWSDLRFEAWGPIISRAFIDTSKGKGFVYRFDKSGMFSGYPVVEGILFVHVYMHDEPASKLSIFNHDMSAPLKPPTQFGVPDVMAILTNHLDVKWV
jgi:hypothetical protein